jgi:hypothetical protein
MIKEIGASGLAGHPHILNEIKLRERKNIENAINAASIHPFINRSSIHIFHLYMKSLH